MFHEEKRLNRDISICSSAPLIPYAPETVRCPTTARTLRCSAEKADLINVSTGILRQARALQLFPLSFTTKPYRIKHLFKCSCFVLHLAFGGLEGVNRLTVCVASLCGFWKFDRKFGTRRLGESRYLQMAEMYFEQHQKLSTSQPSMSWPCHMQGRLNREYRIPGRILRNA